ncbi:hypothetical protein MTO96_011599 [Rhipicephalus appendiculatus]
MASCSPSLGLTAGEKKPGSLPGDEEKPSSPAKRRQQPPPLQRVPPQAGPASQSKRVVPRGVVVPALCCNLADYATTPLGPSCPCRRVDRPECAATLWSCVRTVMSPV